MIQLSTICYSY